MNRLPEMPKLPGGMQSPLCEPCFARGAEARFMEVLVGRSFDDDFGMIQHRCRNCGWMTPQSPVPLYVLAASNLNQLAQIHAVAMSGAPTELSPFAKEIADQVALNPYMLAELAATFSTQLAAALEKIEELNERIEARDAEQ